MTTETNTSLTYVKKNWIPILLIILFLWVMFAPYRCGNRFAKDAPGKNDTVSVKTETRQEQQPIVIMPSYPPQQTGSTAYPVYIPQERQASADYATLVRQYEEIVREFLATRTYKDSIQLKDTAGNRVGVVNLNDQVSENKIVSRQPSYQLSFPHTYTTITIKEPYNPTRQLYIGGGLTGNTVAPVNGVNLGLLYKTKRDRIFNVTAGAQAYDGRLVPQFGLNSYWKISLGKR